MNAHIHNLLEMMDMPKQGILSVTVEENEYVNITLFMMPVGESLSPHTSAMPATVYIIQGLADFTLGEDNCEVKPGDCFFMPPNYRHAVKAKEDLAFLLILGKGIK